MQKNPATFALDFNSYRVRLKDFAHLGEQQILNRFQFNYCAIERNSKNDNRTISN